MTVFQVLYEDGSLPSRVDFSLSIYETESDAEEWIKYLYNFYGYSSDTTKFKIIERKIV